MPATTKVDAEGALLLEELGERLRLARKRRGLSAEKVAQAAGITRVTLARLEVGEPATATLGTLTKVLGVLGMSSDLTFLARDHKVGGHHPRDTPENPAKPRLISLQDLPHLREAASWHIKNQDAQLTPAEVFELYERNWRHIDPEKIVGKEAKILKQLTRTIGKGVLLV